MAYRRSTQHRGSPTATFDSRRYPLRRSPPLKSSTKTRSSSQTSIASSEARPVLVPLHPNLRRLPSRLFSHDTDVEMRDTDMSVAIGSKRKRVVSHNENALGHSKPVRGERRLKRLRSAVDTYRQDSSEESEASTMDVEMAGRWSASEDSAAEDVAEVENDFDGEDSTDDYLITTAPANRLQRLRKDELIRLYTSAGLLDDAESLTKHEIVEAIISSREDIADLPPSSPPRGDGDSSDCSSDDGNIAGGEETDFGSSRRGLVASGLRRRATINDLGRINPRPLKGRSLSMGYFNDGDTDASVPTRSSKTKGNKQTDIVVARRRTFSQNSPHSANSSSTAQKSPPATRTRSRKVSAPTQPLTPISPTSNSSSSRGATGHTKGKGKAKQVEFRNEVDVLPKTPSKRTTQRPDQVSPRVDSDLTDLDELEDELTFIKAQPSPRRLRSKDKELSKGKENDCETSSRRLRKHDEEDTALDATRRVTPRRRAKAKIGCLKEDSTADEAEEEGTDDGQEGEEDLEADEEEEVDELISSASATPPPTRGRRTPVRRRLRPRRVQTFTPPSDGDDEGSAEEGEPQHVGSDEEQADGEGSVADDDDEETIAVEPRRLRNGKIVGEEDVDMDVEEDFGDEEDEEDTADEEVEDEMDEDGEPDVDALAEDSTGDPDADAEGETDEDEPMEEEIDLTIATVKTLVRLRRDDLVRLCESRNLDVAGTKPQLAEALLHWRDRESHEFSSPSSAGTVRPPSTIKRRRHKHGRTSAQNPTTPVLERSDRVHLDEPRTPPISQHPKEPEPELELDLESLGLEDREIPYDRLTKLEKIGSGGFKDVFIGKFKGRKIAIAEFRGQLSAMDIKELKLLGGFNHPNIVRFLGVSIPENAKETPVMIVSELCSNGDLFDYIRNVSPPPSLHKVLSIMLDIARGLEYLHLRKPSVIHRDCKSSNILITSKGTAKIADFGLAKVKQSTRSMVRSLVGTVNWQAPELWHAHPKYNHKVDVFSCAMVYWEMLQWHLPNKKFPWEGMNEHAIYEIVGAKRQRPSISGLRKLWCPEIVDLVERMWAQEHQDRPTMSEVVETLEELVSLY
ncbi:hypothetical protein HGRIS_012951 [Hohenbuehelia grisea]|uniref:Protein kinase domain-containing protein n=1 Tax=Hohenbuehelia grisea TaxID=104357 RepID=A0ABR3IU26_9AGAR